MQVPGRFALGRVDPHVEHHYLAPMLIFLGGIGVALLFVSAGSVLVWSAITLIGVGLGASIIYKAILFVDLYGIERIGLLNVVLTPRRDPGLSPRSPPPCWSPMPTATPLRSSSSPDCRSPAQSSPATPSPPTPALFTPCSLTQQ